MSQKGSTHQWGAKININRVERKSDRLKGYILIRQLLEITVGGYKFAIAIMRLLSVFFIFDRWRLIAISIFTSLGLECACSLDRSEFIVIDCVIFSNFF